MRIFCGRANTVLPLCDSLLLYLSPAISAFLRKLSPLKLLQGVKEIF